MFSRSPLSRAPGLRGTLKYHQLRSAVQPSRAATRTSIGFRTPELLAEHYRKHGGEFGDITREEYLHRAQSLRDTRPGGPVLELTRRDRVIVRFDRASGAFLAFDPDGTIRTFFKPRQGEVYFQRERMRR